MKERILFVLALFLAACAAPHHRPPPTGPSSMAARSVEPREAVDGPRGDAGPIKAAPALVPAPGADPVVARYEGREIRASDAGIWFFKTNRREAFASLSKLIATEILEREAAGLGLRCPPDHVEQVRAGLVAKIQEEAAIAYGLGTTPERYVALRFRQGLEEHLQDRLEEERQRWLFSRVIRYNGLQRDRAELAVIVVKDEALARDIAAKLDEGADFERLARLHSVHESGKDGGRMPPLPREALNPAVAAAAFDLKAGQRTGVLSVDDGAGHRQLEIVRLLRHHPGRATGFEDVRQEIEDGLRERPVDVLEWSAWHLSLERLYNVQVTDNL